MTKGELIRLIEDADDDIPIVIKVNNNAEVPITKVQYCMGQYNGYYIVKG